MSDAIFNHPIITCIGLMVVVVLLVLGGARLLDPYVESRQERFEKIEGQIEILQKQMGCLAEYEEPLARIACLESRS